MHRSLTSTLILSLAQKYSLAFSLAGFLAGTVRSSLNHDVSTGPLACPLARSLARSLTPELVGQWDIFVRFEGVRFHGGLLGRDKSDIKWPRSIP